VFLSTQQAADKLGVNCSRVRALLAQGRIAGAQKVGRNWIIPDPPRILGPRHAFRRPVT